MPSRTLSGSSPAWPSWDQTHGAHDLAGCAEAALEYVLGDEGCLNRVEVVASREALDGQHLGAIVADRQRQAGVDAASVEQDRTCPALAPVGGTTKTLASAQIGLAVKKGATKPDISSVDSVPHFRRYGRLVRRPFRLGSGSLFWPLD
jgi:hypothetical protein